MWALASLVALFAIPSSVSAGPIRRADVTALSSAAVDATKPMAFFAAAAYCSPDTTKNWSCGEDCDALPEFVPTITGGDGDAVQFFYVGFFPPANSVVVAHQGTNPDKIQSVLTDATFVLDDLDPALFPGLPSGIQVHDGFSSVQAKTAQQVLAAVKQTMADHSTKNIMLTGHSLGAAITTLDALFLKLNLPADTQFQITTFGQPRVGNKAFANLIDSSFPGAFQRTTNKHDLVPTIPGRFLGFTHNSGEVHIQDSGNAVSCSGQDSTSSGCTINEVPTVFSGSIADHQGPYFGVTIGTCDDNLRRRSA